MQWKYTGSAVLVALTTLCSTPASAAGPTVAFQGNWVSDCLPLGKNGRHGLIVRLNVSADSFIASGQMFAHNSCDAPLIDFVDKAVLESAESYSGRWVLRLTFSSATMTINNETVAALYAQGSKCGSSTWRVGAPVQVEGRKCDPVSFPPKGAILSVETHTSGNRVIFQNLSAIFGAAPADGAIFPGDVEFHRD